MDTLTVRNKHEGSNERYSVTITEPEYEFGVQYPGEDGNVRTYWGFTEDPRLNGDIDESGTVEIDENYNRQYHTALAVGKRLKVPEVWETL